MIFEILSAGKENAKTARELAALLGCEPRVVTAQIEVERREGQPICAACGENPGYFLAANEQELETYCNQLRNRAAEIFKTRQALLKVLRSYQQKREAAEDENNGK